jgi:hypothetical protein
MSHDSVVKVPRHVAQGREVSNSGEGRSEAAGLSGHDDRSEQCRSSSTGGYFVLPQRYPTVPSTNHRGDVNPRVGVASGEFTELAI